MHSNNLKMWPRIIDIGCKIEEIRRRESRYIRLKNISLIQSVIFEQNKIKERLVN